ncbi:hypothetical protein DVH05_003290 [Phytophthora capsici]|nr:hypothetical protein DVH05_003290 [Phytophthora capsici]
MLISPKGLLRLVSAIVGFMLFVVSCMGFNTIKLSVTAVDTQAEFGCLCFLGVCFGLILAFGESKWELFFFFFGFMRYRLGRSCIFAVSGIMTALLGKTRDHQCDCSDNLILIIEGIALIVMAGLQVLAIFAFGNNSAPHHNKETAATTRVPVLTALPLTSTPLPKEKVQFQAIVQPVAQVEVPVALPPPVAASPATHGDSSLPSWMHTP